MKFIKTKLFFISSPVKGSFIYEDSNCVISAFT